MYILMEELSGYAKELLELIIGILHRHHPTLSRVRFTNIKLTCGQQAMYLKKIIKSGWKFQAVTFPGLTGI
jgi:hypothetical protein